MSRVDEARAKLSIVLMPTVNCQFQGGCVPFFFTEVQTHKERGEARVVVVVVVAVVVDAMRQYKCRSLTLTGSGGESQCPREGVYTASLC